MTDSLAGVNDNLQINSAVIKRSQRKSRMSSGNQRLLRASTRVEYPRKMPIEIPHGEECCRKKKTRDVCIKLTAAIFPTHVY